MEHQIRNLAEHHHKFPIKHRILAMIIGGVIVAPIFAFLFGWVVMLLWNWLMPALFSIKTISYWQAFGIVLLTRLLFGGLHHSHNPHHPHFGHHHFRWAGSDEWAPIDHGNWKYYRQYWKERGKKDFEDYLSSMGKSAYQHDDKNM